MSPKGFSEDLAFKKQLSDYNEKLWKSLHRQWKAKKFCDLKVFTTNGCVSMHACVWSAFSDDMANMVKEDVEAKSEPRLSVSLAVSSEVVLEIASAFYTGTFSPPKTLLTQLYSTTKFLGCSDLHDLITQYWQNNSVDVYGKCCPASHSDNSEVPEDLLPLPGSKQQPLKEKGNTKGKKIRTQMPTKIRTQIPTKIRTQMPTKMRTHIPTKIRTQMPTKMRTQIPTKMRTQIPTKMRTQIPTKIRTQINRIPRSCENTKISPYQQKSFIENNSEQNSFIENNYELYLVKTSPREESFQDTVGENKTSETIIAKDEIKKEQDLDLESEVYDSHLLSAIAKTCSHTGSLSKRRIKIHCSKLETKGCLQVPKSSFGKIRMKHLINKNTNRIASNGQQMSPHSILKRSTSFDLKDTILLDNCSADTDFVVSNKVDDLLRNEPLQRNMKCDGDSSASKCTDIEASKRQSTSLQKWMTLGPCHKIRHHVYVKSNSIASFEKIRGKEDAQYCQKRDCEAHQILFNKGHNLQLPDDFAKIAPALRQDRVNTQKSVKPVLEKLDSRSTSPLKVANLFDCFVSLEVLSLSKEQQARVSENGNSAQSFISSTNNSVGGEEYNSIFGAKTVENTFILDNLDETSKASQHLTQRQLQSTAVKSKRRRCKWQINSQTNNPTPLTPCKTALDNKKTASNEVQTVEMISEKEFAPSSENFSSPIRKRKMSTHLADCRHFGNVGLMQSSEERGQTLKRLRTTAQQLDLHSSTSENGENDSNTMHNSFLNGMDEDILPESDSQDFSSQNMKIRLSSGDVDAMCSTAEDCEVLLTSGGFAETLAESEVERSHLNLGILTNQHEGAASTRSSSSSLKCPKCPMVFLNKGNLSRHLYYYHETCPLTLHCSYCGHLAKTQKDLVQHSTQLHEDSLPFKCPYEKCIFGASQRCKIMNHLFVHSTEKTASCHKCGLLFKSRNLKTHQETCYNQKKYICEVCGKRFNLKCSMQQHVNTVHGGIKKHLCTYCGKMFSDKHNLDRHFLIHKNSFPYPCEFCSSKFRHSNTLKAHVKTKHNIHDFKPLRVLQNP